MKVVSQKGRFTKGIKEIEKRHSDYLFGQRRKGIKSYYYLYNNAIGFPSYTPTALEEEIYQLFIEIYPDGARIQR